MGDRVRVGELLTAAGAIVLTVLLVVGVWFEVDEATVTVRDGAGAVFVAAGSAGARSLGWFALLLVAASAASALWFLYRVLTSTTTERPMLQAPVAYAWAAIAFLALVVRLVIAVPGYELDVPGTDAAVTVPLSVAPGGWVAFAAVWVIIVGLWVAMSDDRVDAEGPKARTAALLASITTRPAPPALGGTPSPDASVVADDALPTEDPSFNPSIRPSGGTA